MKLSMNWLSDFVDLKGIGLKEYCDKMTDTGSKVEGYELFGEDIENVVVGRITKLAKHENSDHLQICTLDLGHETRQIVTGAQNVFEGAIVPVAKAVAKLPGGVVIKPGKLRGVESDGMLCSISELNLTTHDMPGAAEDGILILDESFGDKLGMDIREALLLRDACVEFEITSNRPDCMSIIGLARESAATFNREFKIPEVKATGNSENVNDYASAEIAAPELCSRFIGRVIKNVKIAPSPEWMQKRLKACGIRAINNVVDITNYIMLEYGQPMHAYDLDHVEGHKIIVRRAEEGELLETLDDQPRMLQNSMIAIGDEKRAIGVAGVMGGANSEVCDTTVTVMFESACFNAVAVRRGAKALGMRTDASALFEKGLDPENCLPAIQRACELMEQLGAGEVVGGMIDIYPVKKEQTVLPFEPDKMNRFLGLEVSAAEMKEILARLEFEVKDDKVYVPTFRGDIESMADIAEEVARIYGYDKIPTTMMKGCVTVGGKSKKQHLEDVIRDSLTAVGLYEVTTYSFVDPKENDMILMPQEDDRRNMVRISNPLGEENSVMRTDMLSSVLKVLRTNFSRRNAEAGIFEIGSVYIPKEEQVLPDENQIVAVGMYGGCDFYDIKGKVENMLADLNINDYEFITCKDNPSFHPGRCAHIYACGKFLGIIGQIHPKVAANFKIGVETYCALLDFNVLLSGYTTDRQYKALPKFPATSRDIAVILDKNINVGEVIKIIESNRNGILESYSLFDVYEGEQVGDGKKSVAYSLLFRAEDRTLTDKEVNEVMDKILSGLKEKLNAELR